MRRIFAIAALAGLLGGCAQVITTTTLHPDGSFSRKVVYRVEKSSGLTMGAGEASVQKATRPEDLFKLPSPASSLKIERKEDDKTATITVTRDVGASARLQDIVLWGDKGKVQATSTVSVAKLANGDLEYTETLHAVNPTSKSGLPLPPEVRVLIKKAIPEELQRTELIDEVTKRVLINFAQAMMGPPEPCILEVFLTPEATVRRINAIALPRNTATFREMVPSLTDQQARQAALTLAGAFNSDLFREKNAPSPSSNANSGPNAGTSLFFSVSFPGKVIETNGVIDPIRGDVYWSLLPDVLDLTDVKLRCVVRP